MNFAEYKNVYVVSEVPQGVLKDEALEMTGEARLLADTLGEKVCTILIGSGIQKSQAQRLIACGADEVYIIDSPKLAVYDGLSYAKELADLLKEKKANAVIFSAGSCGRDLAPRVAALLVCGVTADVTELSADSETHLITWSRPAMGGNIMADIISPQYRPQMGTVRPGTFAVPEEDSTRKGEIISVPVTLSADDIGLILRQAIPAVKEENPVEEARIIVAGGRGIRHQKELEQVRELAALVGAAVGAARPAADMGWETQAQQIGQTGKFVTPDVYIALGISGSMQHLCGVKTKVLIAVNNNAAAPIMEQADYAVEADLRTFLPAFIEQVKKIKKSR